MLETRRAELATVRIWVVADVTRFEVVVEVLVVTVDADFVAVGNTWRVRAAAREIVAEVFWVLEGASCIAEDVEKAVAEDLRVVVGMREPVEDTERIMVEVGATVGNGLRVMVDIRDVVEASRVVVEVEAADLRIIVDAGVAVVETRGIVVDWLAAIAEGLRRAFCVAVMGFEAPV